MKDKFKDPMKPKHHENHERHESRRNGNVTGKLVESMVYIALVGAIADSLKK